MNRAAFAEQVREEGRREDQADTARRERRSQVLVTWVPVIEEFPDAELTVLVSLRGGDEPVWFGFTDGKVWYDACTADEFAGSVTHWAELPMGMTP